MSEPRLSEILPGIWTAEVSLPGFEVRSVVLLGATRMLVFDMLVRPGDMRPFAELAGDREIVTVYSHADGDHIWGTAGLPARGGEVVGHASCTDRFRTDVPETLAKKRATESGAWDDVELVAPRWAVEPDLRTVIPSHGDVAGPELLLRNADYLEALRDGREYPILEGTDPFYVEHYERDTLRYGG